MNIDLDDLKDLDIDNIGSWPWLAKTLLLIFVTVGVFGLGYYLDTGDQLAQLETTQKKEITLKSEFETKQKKAANLQAYRDQMARMQETFKTLLQQLPKETEIAGLMDEVSYAGSGAGIEITEQKFLPEKRIDFYIEKPIKIVAIGSYHQIGDFVSRVAKLPRIVTLHDFTIKPSAKRNNLEGDEESLAMEITAKTYRYESEEGL